MSKQYNKLLSLLSFLLILPSTFAFRTPRTGLNALDRGIELIGTTLNITVLENNEIVRLGVTKFAIFVLVLTLVRWSLLKGDRFDNKTASTIAVVFALFSFFLPRDVVLLTAGTISAFIGAALYLTFGVVAMILAFKVFDGNATGHAWLDHLIGLAILLFATFVIGHATQTLSIFLFIPMQQVQKWRDKQWR